MALLKLQALAMKGKGRGHRFRAQDLAMAAIIRHVRVTMLKYGMLNG